MDIAVGTSNTTRLKSYVEELATCPVPITTLVPNTPYYVGTTDASSDGKDGF